MSQQIDMESFFKRFLPQNKEIYLNPRYTKEESEIFCYPKRFEIIF